MPTDKSERPPIRWDGRVRFLLRNGWREVPGVVVEARSVPVAARRAVLAAKKGLRGKRILGVSLSLTRS